MQIRRVHAVYFSGTGTTEKDRPPHRGAGGATARRGAVRDGLHAAAGWQETLHFAPEELVIFGVPTYAGRVPNVLLPFLKERVQGGGALAAAVVLFGNRNFDDSLIELRDILCADGFCRRGRRGLRRGALVFPHARRGPSRRGGHGGDGRFFPAPSRRRCARSRPPRRSRFPCAEKSRSALTTPRVTAPGTTSISSR